MTERKKHYARWIITAVCFLLLVFLYGYDHSKIYISSDTTTTYPMAMDILSGNIWLKGWILGTNNFYFTETVLYAIGNLLGMSADFLLRYLPGVAWALIAVAVPYYLNLWDEKNRTKLIVFYAMYIAFLILIPTSSGYTLLNANSHNNLYAFEMIWLLVLKRYIETERKYLLFVLTLLAGLMYFSESVALMTLFAPVGCVCMFQLVFRKNRKWGFVLLSLIGGFLMGKCIYLLFSLMGGMDTRGLPVGIVKDGFMTRLRDWINQFGILMGIGDIRTVQASPYVVFIRVMIVFFAISLIVYAIRFFRLSWERQILYSIVAVNLLASEMTNVVVFHRYIVPGWYFGWILAILLAAESISAIDARFVRNSAITAVCAACCWSGYKKAVGFAEAPLEGQAQKELAAFLEEKNLGTGYGDFWLASSTSFFTDYTTDIYPVRITPDSDTMKAYEELIRKDWYSEKDVHYILSYADPAASLFINHEAMISILGEPDETYIVGQYAVYYWDKDISDYLNNGFYDGKVEPYEMTVTDNVLTEDGKLILPSQSSISGPGTIITKGNYDVTISGENLDQLSVTAYSDVQGTEYSLDSLMQTSDEILFSFNLKEDVSDLRFNLTNPDDEAVCIDQLIIQEG